MAGRKIYCPMSFFFFFPLFPLSFRIQRIVNISTRLVFVDLAPGADKGVIMMMMRFCYLVGQLQVFFLGGFDDRHLDRGRFVIDFYASKRTRRYITLMRC